MRDLNPEPVLLAELDRIDRELAVVEGDLSGFAGGQGPQGETERADEIATEHVERTFDRTLHHELEYQRGEVQSALARLTAGTYGVCERCSAEIPVERLEAVPWTRTCVHCA